MDIPGQHCGKAYYGLNARNELVCPTCGYNPLQQNESPSRATAVVPATMATQQNGSVSRATAVAPATMATQQNGSLSRATAVASALDTQQTATAVASQTVGDKSYQNSLNRKIGKEAELATHIVLLSHYAMVQPIHTGWGIQRDKKGNVVTAWPLEKVAGDFTAIESDTGKFVLVEVKTHKSSDEPKLKWGDFRSHQRDALTAVLETDAIPIACWVIPDDTGYIVNLLHWGKMQMQGFKKRKPLQRSQISVCEIAQPVTVSYFQIQQFQG